MQFISIPSIYTYSNTVIIIIIIKLLVTQHMSVKNKLTNRSKLLAKKYNFNMQSVLSLRCIDSPPSALCAKFILPIFTCFVITLW